MFKVGDRVECINQRRYGCVEQGKFYTVFSINNNIGRIELKEVENFGCVYNSEDFKLVEDDMKIKITKWEDLDGIENGKYKIANETNFICIEKGSGNADLVIPKDVFDIKETIAIINSLGFQIEFTALIKLTREEWHFVRAFKEGWVCCNKSGRTGWTNKKPQRCGDCWTGIGHDVNREYTQLMSGVFAFITWESEPWSIESLRELGCEEGIV